MRDRLRGESGMTLPEVLVAAVVMAIAATIFLAVMDSVQRGLAKQIDRSISNDQARLAVQQLDREIRSGNVLYDPATENDATNGIYPGMSLRIYTQTNANTNSPGFRCVQWRINNDELQRRYWAVNWRENPSGLVSTFRTFADHIVNRSVNPQVTAFSLDTSQSAYGTRLVKISIVANQNSASGRNVVVNDSVEGRNTTFGYPNNACSDIPPY
jgi:prepilin-type N-terminal cleavage/methylation domain-containing protein